MPVGLTGRNIFPKDDLHTQGKIRLVDRKPTSGSGKRNDCFPRYDEDLTDR